MQADFDAHLPSADIQIVAINKEGDEEVSDAMAAKGDLPLLQDVDDNNDTDSDTWTDYSAAWRDVRVVDRDGEMSDVLVNLSSADLRTPAIFDQVKADIRAFATRNNVAASDWQNETEPLDVTNDEFVSPQDVLANVLEINTNGARDLGAPSGEVTLFHDVDGDGWLAPRDVLRTVLHINRISSGSGEPPVGNAATDAIFAALQAANEQDDES